MAKVVMREVVIQREECWAAGAQQRNDLAVLDAFTANIDADLFQRNAPRFEHSALVFEEVLIQNNRAAANSSMCSSAC